MISLKSEKQLRNLGLNSYEVRVWVALLCLGTSTAGEISNTANIPRSRSYDVLKSLERKGFVKPKQGKPTCYVALHPHKTIEKVQQNLLKRADEETKSLREGITKGFAEKLSRLRPTKQIGKGELNGVVKGRQNLYYHMESMLNRAEKWILFSADEEGFIEIVERFYPLLEKLGKRVVVKFRVPINNKTRKHAERIKKLAVVVHTENNTKLCIIDDKEMLFTTPDSKSTHPTFEIGIWATTPFTKDLCKIMF